MRVCSVVRLALLVLLGSVGAAAAQASAENGETVFKKCRVCHDIGEGAKNKIGPRSTVSSGARPAAYRAIPIPATSRRWLRRASFGTRRISTSTCKIPSRLSARGRWCSLASRTSKIARMSSPI
jgi:hypothetical protein